MPPQRPTGGFDPLQQAFAGPAAGAIGMGAGLIGSPIGLATQAFQPLTQAVQAATDKFQNMGKGMESFIAKASPGSLVRFNLALDDTKAVLGQRLVPVFEILTKALRLFGDFLNSILPDADEFADLLAPINELLDELREALAPVARVIKDVLVFALKQMAEVLKIVIIPFKLLAEFLKGLFGYEEGVDKLKSSQGAAVRNVTFTSAQQHAQSVYAAAFKMGAGGPEGKRQKGPLDYIQEDVKQLGQMFKEFGAWLREAFGKVSEWVRDIWETVAKPVEKAGEMVEGWRQGALNAFERWLTPGARETKSGYARYENEDAAALQNRLGGLQKRLHEIMEASSIRGMMHHALPPDVQKQVIADLLKEIRELANVMKQKGIGGGAGAEGDIKDAMEQGALRGLDGFVGWAAGIARR